MVIDNISYFMSQMDDTVLTLTKEYDDFYLIMKNNHGIHQSIFSSQLSGYIVRKKLKNQNILG